MNILIEILLYYINIFNVYINYFNLNIDIIDLEVYIIDIKRKEGDRMYQVISSCPVCRKKLKVVKLQCENCDTVIENDFCLSKFDYLSTEDLFFAETFLKCRGNIKEVEKELKISYPTVRSRLDDIIQKLDGNPNVRSNVQSASSSRKKEILNALENGEITPEEALEQMKEN